MENIPLSLVVLLIVLAIQTSMTTANVHQEDFNGFRYTIPTNETFNWANGLQVCEDNNSNLIYVDSTSEMQFIIQFIQNYGKSLLFWTCGNDIFEEGKVVWNSPNGGEVLKSLWGPGEPNNQQGNENCAEIKWFLNEYSMNDAECSLERIVICKKYSQPMGTKILVSEIPNYFPTFSALCKDGSTTILDKIVSSGQSLSFLMNYMGSGDCTLRWGSASVTFPVLGKDLHSRFDVDELKVTYAASSDGSAGTQWLWQGTKPELPVGTKSIVSHIPRYLSSFTARCKSNATTLPAKELTSGETHSYTLDYLTSGDCTLSWGSARITFPVSGRDLASTFIVDEIRVTYAQSTNGSSGTSWPWTGTKPTPPIGSKRIVSRIPNYLPSFSVECYNNATALSSKILQSGETHTYSLEYLNSGHCLLVWGSSTVTFMVSGKDLDSQYDVDEIKVKCVQSANGTVGTEWRWKGTTPKVPIGTKSILSRIPNYFPEFSAKCTQNTTNVLDKMVGSGQSQTYEMTYLSTGTCTLKWGAANVTFPVAGKDLHSGFDVDEQRVTYATSSNGTEGATWAWQGTTPPLPIETKYITSHIPYYLPTLVLTCRINSTTTSPVTISTGETYSFDLDILTNANCSLTWDEAEVSFPINGLDSNSRFEVNELHVAQSSSTSNDRGNSWDWKGVKPAIPIGIKTLSSRIPHYFPSVQATCMKNTTLYLHSVVTMDIASSFELDYISSATCTIKWGDASVIFEVSGKDMDSEFNISGQEVTRIDSNTGIVVERWNWEGEIPKMPEGKKSIVSHIPYYLGSFSVECSTGGVDLPKANVSSGDTNHHLVKYIDTSSCTLTWGTASVTFALIGSDLDSTFKVDEVRVTFAYSSNGTAGETYPWIGSTPTPPTGIKSLVSHIPYYMPAVHIICKQNSTTFPVKALTSGETYSFVIDYLSTGNCKLTWSGASILFPFSGKDLTSRFDIDEQKVKFSSNVNGTIDKVWEWSGVKPGIPVGVKSIVSNIPSYLPSVTMQCTINSTTLATNTLLSGDTLTVELNFVSNAMCTLKWDSVIIIFPIMGKDLNSQFVVDERQIVYVQSDNGETGESWTWQGSKPTLPSGVKEIVSHIPHYLPSVDMQCFLNSTALPNQTLTSGATQSYDLDYLSSTECTLKWGSATLILPISGKDLTSRFEVDEQKVTHAQSANGTEGQTWYWDGPKPAVPIGTKSIVSHIPDYLPTILIECDDNSTAKQPRELASGQEYRYIMAYLNSGICKVTWGSASLVFTVSGRDLDSQFNIDENKVVLVSSSNGTTGTIWNFNGTKPALPSGIKTIRSAIPAYLPSFQIQCSLNDTQFPLKNVTSGKTYQYDMDMLTSGSCTLVWGEATTKFTLEGNDLESEFEVYETHVLYSASARGTSGQIWNWTGPTPKAPEETKTIISHIPDYLPELILECSKNQTITDKQKIASGYSHSFNMDILTSGECKIQWGNATVSWNILGKDKDGVFDVYVNKVQLTRTTGDSDSWYWLGHIPIPPTAHTKSIQSAIPSYLPSFAARCSNNGTEVLNKIFESGDSNVLIINDITSQASCVANWGNAQIAWELIGSEIYSKYVVYESHIASVSTNGVIGQRWNWAGSIPQIPQFTKEHISTLPPNLESIILTCVWNDTRRASSIVVGGDSFSYQLDLLSTSVCNAVWGNSSVSWSEIGSDMNSRYQLTKYGVEYVSSKNGPEFEVYNWEGTTPTYDKTFVSKIPSWYPKVKLDCFDYGETTLDDSGTHDVTISVQKSSNCLLMWGEAYLGIEIDGINGDEEFQVFEWGILLSESPEIKENWKGQIPETTVEVVSKLESYFPTVELSCYRTDTLDTYVRNLAFNEKMIFSLSAVGKSNCAAQWEYGFSDFVLDALDGRTTLEIRRSHVVVTSSEAGTVGQKFEWSGSPPSTTILISSHIEASFPDVSITCSDYIDGGIISQNSPFEINFLVILNPSCKLQWGSGASLDFTLSGANYHANYDIYNWGLNLTSSSSSDAGTRWLWNV